MQPGRGVLAVFALLRGPALGTRRQLGTSKEANGTRLAPMMQQYLARKKEYPDCVMLFQVGDFYELFGADARRVSPLLNLALAKRSKQASDMEIMCGFPIAALNSYLEKLVMHHGLKVAICNQVESPQEAKKRGSSAIVNRQVVRVATPGSLVEDAMLKPEENNYLACICLSDSRQEAAVTWTDLSTGEFLTTHCTSVDKLQGVLLRCAPKEVLLDPKWEQDDDTMSLLEEALPNSCMKTFRTSSDGFLPSPTMRQQLESLASSLEQQAAHSLLEYIGFTQKQADLSAMIKPPKHIDANDHMIIDPSAWKSLEITRTLGGSKSLSLLASIDRTVTASGSRLLATQLASPLMSLEMLNDRLDVVEFLVEASPQGILKSFRNGLDEIADIERSLQRLSLSAGSPRDLKNIATTVQEADHLVLSLQQQLDQLQLSLSMPKLLMEALDNISSPTQVQQLAQTIQNAVHDDVTCLNSLQGFVKPGYSRELDEWREILQLSSPSSTTSIIGTGTRSSNVNQSNEHLDQLQVRYRQQIGSKRLRVNHQRERGFFIEVPHEESHLVPQHQDGSLHDNWRFFHSTKRVVRYRTKELDQMHFKLLHAQQQVDFLEKQIFDDLKRQVCDPETTRLLQALGSWLAQCDVFCSHAQVAVARKYTRPYLDWSLDLHIEEGRHAIVEAAQDFRRSGSTGKADPASVARTRLGGASFVPNSLHLGRESPVDYQLSSCWLLTGPNMGGKSTFLRQNAHLVILSQIGSFVPARFAKLGLVDRVFSRVGSSDELAKHRSTFLVEMQETSTILKQATPRSFVLMDEIGRGTSVQDGMAIAAAVLEEICGRHTRCLFATHFTQLANWFHQRRELQCHQMEILQLPPKRRQLPTDAQTASASNSSALSRPKGGNLVFSYRVVPGIASCSYGINTAALAGCPPKVIERAEKWLCQIDSEQQHAQTTSRLNEATRKLRDIEQTLELEPQDARLLMEQVRAILERPSSV